MASRTESMQGVTRAFSVLRFVARAGASGARVADVSLQLGMHKASASRLLNTLVGLGVLERGDRRFHVSEDFRATVGAPASVARIRRAARPSLARIADALGDAAFLSVRAGLDALCIERQVGPHPLQALSLDVGNRRPLGVGAGSAALVAWLPEAEREATIAAQAGRLAAYPAFSIETIGEICRAACARGVTFIPNRVVAGMTGMGIGIRDGAGLVVAALSVAVVGDRLEGGRGERAAALLEQERRATEARLAGRGPASQDLPPEAAAE
jgi:DNA-binding IclR family transcriptional regulator